MSIVLIDIVVSSVASTLDSITIPGTITTGTGGTTRFIIPFTTPSITAITAHIITVTTIRFTTDITITIRGTIMYMAHTMEDGDTIRRMRSVTDRVYTNLVAARWAEDYSRPARAAERAGRMKGQARVTGPWDAVA